MIAAIRVPVVEAGASAAGLCTSTAIRAGAVPRGSRELTRRPEDPGKDQAGHLRRMIYDAQRGAAT